MPTASMKSIRSPPLPFRITGTTQLEDWKNWQRSFRLYAKSINLEQECHDVQLCIFKSLVGPDALEIYNTFSLADITDVESVIRKFDERFKPKVNVTSERYKLYQLHQKSGQNFDDFLSDVTNQVDKCAFSSMRDEIVLYKLVGGIDDDEIRAKLLADADLNYEKAVKICRAVHFACQKEDNCRGSFMKKKENLCKTQKISLREVEESLLKSAENDQIVSSEITIIGSRSLAEEEEESCTELGEKSAYGSLVERGSYKKPIKVGTSLDDFGKDSVVLNSPNSGHVEEEGLQSDMEWSDDVDSDWTGNDNCYVYDPDHLRLQESSALKLGSAVEKFLEQNVVYKERKKLTQPAVEFFFKENLCIKGENISTRPPDSKRVKTLSLRNEDDGSDRGYGDGRDDTLETKAVAKSLSKKRTSQTCSRKRTSQINCKPGETVEKPKNFPCDICGRIFATRNSVTCHKRTHVQVRKFTCYYCGSQYKLKRYLVRHIVRKHPGMIDSKETLKTYSCEHCGYETFRATNFQRHKYQHTEEKPFSCELCEYKCIVPRLMKAHMAKHTGEKPFPCSLCSKRFVEPSTLKNHMLTHMPREEKVKQRKILEGATCDVCGKVFSHKSNLKVHSLRHTGEKRMACHICGFRTVTSMELASHLRVHSDEKPFVCFNCNYSCKYKSALQKHIKTHLGEKAYACKVCGRKFSQSAHVKRHMMTHTGEKPYVCDVCGHSWTQASNLKAHMKVHEKQSGQRTPSNKQQKPVVFVVAADSDESELYEDEYTAADAIMTWSEQVSVINSVDYHAQS